MTGTLPTFITIGTAKAGTTSLHRYLGEHPEIAMTSEKEPMCFERPDWEERLTEYEELFEDDAAVRGESSTAYSAYPWAPEIPDRVRATIPDAKLIYCVRDPVDRMIAHYAQMVWDRFPVRPWDELMDDLEDPMNIPVWQSRYATQYERWAERFGEDQILVLDKRDLAERRDETMRRVFEFLGVDPEFRSERWNANHNTAQQHVVPTSLGERLGDLRRPFERIPGVRRLMTRLVRKPTLTPEQRERVEGILRPEADRFRELTGMPFSDWSV